MQKVWLGLSDFHWKISRSLAVTSHVFAGGDFVRCAVQLLGLLVSLSLLQGMLSSRIVMESGLPMLKVTAVSHYDLGDKIVRQCRDSLAGGRPD